MSRLNGVRTGLLASVSLATLLAGAANAQENDPTTVDDIVVTGTLRGASTVQDAPINIAAIGAEQIEALGVTDLAQISRYVPGLYIVDQGPRNANRIVVRGLNIDPLGESVGQGAGGTVATYLGEVPIAIDLKLNDVERVEFLLGPQGTLYGAGTLGGAIRYIPNAPAFDERFVIVRGDAYGYSEGENVSTDFGFTANLPLGETLALRANIDQLNDQGFIDQPFLVRGIGTSLANAFGSVAAINANMLGKEDVNTEDVLSGRLALRWQPTAWLDATLSHNYQNSDVGGRQVSGRRVSTFPVQVGEYEAVQRVEEPNERTSQLTALEIELDLGWANLTSATGYQTFEADGQRDQTDLLISLGYSYEAFPAFTAFTRELQDDETVTQELRLTSKPESGAFSWILGAYYSNTDYQGSSSEFTPGFDAFAVAEFGGGQLRPDSLEYLAVDFGEITETALFGELTYEIMPGWQITGGARRYTYELATNSATDLPLLETVFNGRGPTSIVLDFESDTEEEDGWLYKLNTSYKISPDILLYGTISDGFRAGGSNNLTACTTTGGQQNVCGQPDELIFTSETTRNYEIGIKSQLWENRLTLNAAAFYIDWQDPQVAGATLVGLSPIVKNGEGAETSGFEVSFQAVVTERFSLRGSYSYAQAELTDDAPNLLTTLTPPGFDTDYVDGIAGDRLPGSPEYQASLYAEYNWPLSNGLDLDFAYGFTASGDVLTRTGSRAGGVTLPAYQIHNASVRLSAPGADWAVTGYIDNLWDEYAETGARSTPLANQVLSDINGAPVYSRNHFANVLPPRKFGVRFTKRFGL